MNLQEIVRRTQPPVPWAEGEKIPWNEPGFSARMLNEHLSQTHDLASRRSEIIDRHVAWIHDSVLGGCPSRVLDLGCGPGLYTQRLARLGHCCTGVDFGPASIAYARGQAAAEGLACRYIEADMRTIGALALDPVDLVMLVYGEFNVFRQGDMLDLLQTARRLLVPGGRLLLEPHTHDAIREVGSAPATWYSAEIGLFSERPHLMLMENHWDETRSVATERFYLIDAASSEMTRYAASMQAYTDAEYAALLQAAGFAAPERYASLAGNEESTQPWLFALVVAAVEPATR
jgi:SAM-dependent methyltransferase